MLGALPLQAPLGSAFDSQKRNTHLRFIVGFGRGDPTNLKGFERHVGQVSWHKLEPKKIRSSHHLLTDVFQVSAPKPASSSPHAGE